MVATKSAEAKPDHTGDVYKQGHSAFGTSFQKRLFVLNDSDGDGKWTIKYYKGPAEAANLKGTIVLAGASVTKKSTDEFEGPPLTTPAARGFPREGGGLSEGRGEGA